MNSFIREFISDGNDEYRVTLFKRILAVTFSLGFIVVVLLTIYNIRQTKIQGLNDKLAETILNFLTKEGDTDWQDLLKQSKDIPLADFAKLRLVSTYLQKNSLTEAVQILQEINSKSIIVDSYVKITLLGLYLDHPNILDAKMAERYIRQLSTAQTPFNYTSKILQSLYYIKEGQQEKAITILQNLLSNDQSPEFIKIQAKALLKKIY